MTRDYASLGPVRSNFLRPFCNCEAWSSLIVYTKLEGGGGGGGGVLVKMTDRWTDRQTDRCIADICASLHIP